MHKFSVKKPFTILVAVIATLILGGVSVAKMQLDLLPEISLPYLLVITTYPGASASKVEAEICEPMEGALGTINGVKNIYSVCNENYGMVQLEFLDDTDIDSAMVKVSSALNTLESTLPEECGTPSIMELGTDMLASEYLGISKEGMSIEELSQFTEDKIVPEFERLDGVANVTSLGLVEKTVQIELNKDKVDVLNDKILATMDDAFADAVEQLEDAKKQLEDSKEKLDDSKADLIEAQSDLEDNKKDLADGRRELDDSVAELDDKQKELDSNKEELKKQKEELEKKKKETYDKLSQASAIMDELKSYQTQLVSKKADLTSLQASKKAIDKAATDLLAYIPSLDADSDGNLSADELSPLSAGLSKLGLSISSLADKSISDVEGEVRSAADSKIDSYSKEIDALNVEIATTEAIISGYESELKALGYTYEDVERMKLEASAGFGSADAQMTIGETTLISAQASIDSAYDNIDDALKQLDDGQKAINDGQEKIDDGWKQLSDGEEQLSDGWEDYNDAVKTYEKQRAEAVKKANADDLLKLSTLAQIIYAQNFAMPAGYVDDELDNSWLVEVGDNFDAVEQLENSVLCNIHDVGDVKLSDVSDITIIDNADDSYVRYNGNQAVILSIFKSSTAGTNDVSKLCKAKIEELQNTYDDLSVMVLTDQGDYIDLIVKSVLQSMIIGAILAIIVLAIFLKDIKPTIVVAISIPLSVLAAFVCMYFAGISLNMLSLSGMALGIGMLVDNSIVVIENIYRLRSRGMEAPRAAVQGTKQVAGAIISSTLTTACVFLPMVYTTGMVNDLMTPMCLTIIFCLLASLIVSMSVAPAAASTILKNCTAKKHTLFDKVMVYYEKALDYCLRVKLVPIAVSIILLGLTAWQVVRMGIVMIPEMTVNQIEASVEMDENMDREECYAAADEIMDRLLAIEGVGDIGILNGGDEALFTGMSDTTSNFRNYSLMILTSNPKAGSDEIKSICKSMEECTAGIEGVTFSVATAMSEMDSLFGAGLSVDIYGNDIDELLKVSEDVMEIVDQVDGYIDISNGQEDADKVIHLAIDKNKAMSLGLSVAQIYEGIASKTTLSADSVKINIDGIDMKVKIVDEMEPLTKENLMDYSYTVEVTDDDGDKVTQEHKLAEFATVEIRDGINAINRENQNRYITVTAGVDEGYNTTLLTRQLKPLIENYKAPNGVEIDLGGEYDSVVEMLKQMALVIALGLAFIYLVMVAQFQSLLSPFIVMFTIPLAFTGGLLALWCTGENLSTLSIMGFVVLMGTVVNNGIVFVDYTNQLRKQGLDRKTALIATGKTRMRPILMTALTTILAESNLIFGDDMGAQLGRGMALVIAGGLAYATLMTLFIIPVMYDILFKKQPLDVDTGSEDLDDAVDDAAEYIESTKKLTSAN
ncbi:MAG: efflux RND transporter permease subunit [Lachnospiraceae bacterium]|nr:efflux RND transporter permease subunit [Candidatus Colinaster equi]